MKGDEMSSVPDSNVMSMRREQKHCVPRVMATNPLYEGTSTLYSYLPDPKDLKRIEEEQSHSSESPLEIPPQVYIQACMYLGTYYFQ